MQKPPFQQDHDVVVKLADGPCAGAYATVRSFGMEAWQRLDRREQVFLRYVKNLFAPGEYVWSGEAATEDELAEKLVAVKRQGQYVARSHGA